MRVAARRRVGLRVAGMLGNILCWKMVADRAAFIQRHISPRSPHAHVMKVVQLVVIHGDERAAEQLLRHAPHCMHEQLLCALSGILHLTHDLAEFLVAVRGAPILPKLLRYRPDLDVTDIIRGCLRRHSGPFSVWWDSTAFGRAWGPYVQACECITGKRIREALMLPVADACKSLLHVRPSLVGTNHVSGGCLYDLPVPAGKTQAVDVAQDIYG